jgi:hypothetical protein
MDDIRNTDRYLVDNETFIDLIRIAQENIDIKERLMVILKLDRFNRNSILNTWLRDLKLQGAPKGLIEALSAFLDDGIAEKALEVIESKA